MHFTLTRVIFPTTRVISAPVTFNFELARDTYRPPGSWPPGSGTLSSHSHHHLFGDMAVLISQAAGALSLCTCLHGSSHLCQLQLEQRSDQFTVESRVSSLSAQVPSQDLGPKL